jgi:hypothetical protein
MATETARLRDLDISPYPPTQPMDLSELFEVRS